MGKAALETLIRNDILNRIIEMIENELETDALPVSASELAIPVLDAEGNERFALIKVSIPRGTRNGEGGYIPYDGYTAHDLYMDEIKDKKADQKKTNKKTKEKDDPNQYLPNEISY